MKGIAIIPARGGSKRLKDKNIRDLAGKPLIYWTLDLLAKQFATIMVASDSQAICDIVFKHWSTITITRLPPDTTTDKSTVLDSICWLLDEGHLDDCDYIGLFLPTCPLRSIDDIQEGIKLLTKDVDGVISTTDYEFPPTLGLVKDQDGLLHCSDPSLPWLIGNTRSQDHSSVIRPNGAFYLKWIDKFRRDRNFYKGRIRGYHMPKSRSADIDDFDDLQAIDKRLQS